MIYNLYKVHYYVDKTKAELRGVKFLASPGRRKMRKNADANSPSRCGWIETEKIRKNVGDPLTVIVMGMPGPEDCLTHAKRVML